MKKRFTALLLMLAILIIPAAAASTYRQQIAVEYGITLNINGQQAVLKDPNGKTVQPFVYNGTTYVPIRAVSENLGAAVTYDQPTNTAHIIPNTDLEFVKENTYLIHLIEKAGVDHRDSINMYIDTYASSGNSHSYTAVNNQNSESKNEIESEYTAISSKRNSFNEIYKDYIMPSYRTLANDEKLCYQAYISGDISTLTSIGNKFLDDYYDLSAKCSLAFDVLCGKRQS